MTENARAPALRIQLDADLELARRYLEQEIGRLPPPIRSRVAGITAPLTRWMAGVCSTLVEQRALLDGAAEWLERDEATIERLQVEVTKLRGDVEQLKAQIRDQHGVKPHGRQTRSK